MKRTNSILAILPLLVGLMLTTSMLQAQYPRTVLIEEFTSVTCAPCVEATRVMNEVLQEKGERVVSLRYHMNIPCPGDPWYQESKSHVDNRSQLYGVTGIPTARVDGVTAAPNNKPELLTAVNSELQETSPIKVSVAQEPVGESQVKVTVTVESDGGSLPNGFELHVALAEHLITRSEDELKDLNCYNGETEFHDVFRRLLTPPNGMPINVPGSGVITEEFTYTPDAAWIKGEIFAVAWVQDDFTNEVTQTGYSPKFDAGVPISSSLAGGIRSLRPNPAGQSAQMEIELESRSTVTITLTDPVGQVVVEFEKIVEAGQSDVPINLEGVPAGSYLATVRWKGGQNSASLVVVR